MNLPKVVEKKAVEKKEPEGRKNAMETVTATLALRKERSNFLFLSLLLFFPFVCVWLTFGLLV